jgi:hypothetical protein
MSSDWNLKYALINLPFLAQALAKHIAVPAIAAIVADTAGG